MTWKVGDAMTREVLTVGPQEGFKTCVDLLRIHASVELPPQALHLSADERK